MGAHEVSSTPTKSVIVIANRRVRCPLSPKKIDKVTLTHKKLASPAREVASAVCAEVGEVKLSFIRISRKPLSQLCSPKRAPRLNFFRPRVNAEPSQRSNILFNKSINISRLIKLTTAYSRKKLATKTEASLIYLFFFLKCTNTNTIMQII